MKKFDENYILLEEMFDDGYFPDFLVEKIKKLIENKKMTRYDKIIV